MDVHSVLSTLFFNRPDPQSAESLARILGMVHLYRTSGIHFLAFFTFLEWGLARFFRLFHLRVRTGKWLTLGLCLVSILWIWSLQDFRPSLLRPIATFLFRSFFKNRGAVTQIIVPLVLTWFTEWISMGNPYQTFGALHYYFAVAGGLLAWQRVRLKSPLIQHVYLAVGSWLPIAAHDLWQDHLIAYMTPFYSWISLPVITLFLYPLTLTSLLFQKEIHPAIVELWQTFLDLLWQVPESSFTFASASSASVFLSMGFAAGISFFWPKLRFHPRRMIFAGAMMILLFTLRFALGLRPPLTQVTQLDVGQGDSALFQKRDRVEMVDLGSYRALKTDAWIRKLSRFHVTRLDAILLTHFDEDHTGGLGHLAALLPIDCIETHVEHLRSEKAQPALERIRRYAPRIQIKSEGCMRMTEPHWFRSFSHSAKGNELMAGVVFELDQNAAYYALGDGDQEQEALYVRRFKDQIASHPYRILKVGHHGSKYSSGDSFLKEIHAREFWVSAGRRNRYHHPNPLALLRMQHWGGRIYRTDEVGDITARVE